MTKVMEISREECTGCGLCELACSFEKEEEFNPFLSRIKVERNEGKGFFIPVLCIQCQDRPCIEECPSQALIKNSETGGVEWYKDECIGCDQCDMCLTACPFGAITYVNSEVMICDLCQGEPECVKICPHAALKLVDAREVSQKKIESALSKNLELLREGRK